MALNGKITKTKALSGTLTRSSGGGSVQEIYWVQYGIGTATNAEVNLAVSENKLPICYWDVQDAYGKPLRRNYYLIRHTPTNALFAAVDDVNKTILVRRLFADSWSTQTISYQETLTWDTTPRSGSLNPVTSDGIYQAIQAGGGGGTSDYTDLTNKPQINGNTLTGNKTAANLGLATPSDIPAAASSGTPAMDGTASRGSSAQYARADHVHPTDTSRAAASDLAAKADKVTEVTVSTAGAVTQALDAGKIYHFTGALTALTITLNAPASGQLAQYHFDFNSGSTAATLTMPNTVTMPDSFAPEASKHYEVDILNNYGAVVSWTNS